MTNVPTITFALAAGLIAALNPCGFALLPGYLTLVVAGDDAATSRTAAVGRALAATVMMALGFVVVFGAFALVLAPFAVTVQRYLPALTVVIGAGLIALGVWMLAGRELPLLIPKPRRGAPTARLRSMFGYGVGYAIASLSCTIGPFLAVTAATFHSGSLIDGIAAYLAYAAGMALLIGVLATAIALAAGWVIASLRGAVRHLTRIGAVLLVLTGAYVAYYGVYELRLNAGAAQANDPIIDGATHLQQKLSSWVGALGALPPLLLLAGIIAGAFGVGWARRLTGFSPSWAALRPGYRRFRTRASSRTDHRCR